MLARLVLTTVLAAPLAAQDLDLTIDGGGIPGQVVWDLGPAQPAQLAFIIVSFTPGPTPLALIDPLDPRVLDVGTPIPGASQAGVFALDGHFRPPPIPVPNVSSLAGATLFLQGLSAPGNPRLVDRVSEPRVIRLQLSGGWRDRLVALSTPRSFVPIVDLPRGEWIALGGGSGALFAQLAQNTTDIYDPIRDQFGPGPSMLQERSLHTVTRLVDGRYLIVGGVDVRNDPSNTAEIFDPATRSFSPAAGMAINRMGHAAALLPDGRVLVSGGMQDMNQPASAIDPIYSTTDTTEIYDPIGNTWTRGPNMSQVRVGHSAIVLDNGKVLHAGGVGYRRIIFNIPWVEDTVDIYDASVGPIGAFVAGSVMGQAKGVYAHIKIGPGRHLFTGGVGAISLTRWGALTAVAEIYDEGSDTWGPAGSMARPRGLHVAYDLGGGRILQVGGADGTLFALTPLASCEIYDVGTGQWSAGPRLARSRAAFGSYVTDTGQLHVVAGQVAQTGVDNSTVFFYR